MSYAAEMKRVQATDAIHAYVTVALDYDAAHTGRITDQAIAFIDNQLAQVLPPHRGQNGEGDCEPPSPTSSLHILRRA